MNQELKDFLEKNTSLSEVEISEAMKYIPLESYKKGTILQVQGEITEKCYFILNGCIRQYSVGEDGRETTYHFFTKPTTYPAQTAIISMAEPAITADVRCVFFSFSTRIIMIPPLVRGVYHLVVGISLTKVKKSAFYKKYLYIQMTA